MLSHIYGTIKAWREAAFSRQQRIKVNGDLASSDGGEQDRQARLSLQSEHDSWNSEYIKPGVIELRVVVATGQL